MKTDPQVTIVVTNLPDTVFSILFDRIAKNIIVALESYNGLKEKEFIYFRADDEKEMNVLIYSKSCGRLTCVVADESIFPVIYDALKQNNLILSNGGKIQFHYTGCERVYVDYQVKKIGEDFGDLVVTPAYNGLTWDNEKFLAATITSVD